MKCLHVDVPTLRGVVDANVKQRFEMVPAPVPVSPSSPLPLPLPLQLHPETTPDTDTDTDTDTNTSPNTDSKAPVKRVKYLIRATQGHSIKGLDPTSLLTPILVGDPDFPAEVVHGTYPAAWRKIQESRGLKSMGRVYVHFAVGLPGKVPEGSGGCSSGGGGSGKEIVEEEGGVKDDGIETGKEVGGAGVGAGVGAGGVVSGMRASASILIWVDVGRSIEGGGVRWWRSRNGVVLTDGVKHGMEGDGGGGGGDGGEREGLLGLEYISRVVDRRSGDVIWKNEWWEEEGGA